MSGLVLRRLPETDFQRLKSAVQKRAQISGAKPRSAKNLSRQLEKRRRRDKRVKISKKALLTQYSSNVILDSLVPNRKDRWKNIAKRKKIGNEVECIDFSFLDNPIKTFNTLQKIALLECEVLDFKIHFVDEFLKDIAPFLVFGVMREGMAPITSGGTVRSPTRKVLEAVGLREFLRMKPFGRMRLDDVWPLPLMQRRAGGTSRSTNIATEPTALEKRADKIAEGVDLWLGKLDPPEELTEYGLSKIKGIVTEILNNAERHGRIGGDGEWIVAGFMARRDIGTADSSRNLHICHLSFLNLGSPISETIANGPTTIVSQIDQYRKMHASSGLSGETLATVFAMQDGISRLRQGDGQPTGGTGLMDMVEFVNEVGACTLDGYQPKVAVLSGSSYLKFEDPYGEGRGKSRRLQWFNQPNVVTTPPSKTHVMDLPQPFPGTLVTMRFVLDGAFQADGNDDN